MENLTKDTPTEEKVDSNIVREVSKNLTPEPKIFENDAPEKKPIKNPPDWTNIVQAISNSLLLLITAISLIYIAKQVYTGNRGVEAESVSKLIEHSNQIMNYMAENPELYDYFYSGKEIAHLKDTVLAPKIKIAALMYADLFEHIVLRSVDMKETTSSGWKSWINDLYLSSPAIRSLLKEREYWYSPELIEMLELERAHQIDSFRINNSFPFLNSPRTQE